MSPRASAFMWSSTISRLRRRIGSASDARRSSTLVQVRWTSMTGMATSGCSAYGGPMLAQMTDDPLGGAIDDTLEAAGATAAAEHIEFDAEQAHTWMLAVAGGDGAALGQDDAAG